MLKEKTNARNEVATIPFYIHILKELSSVFILIGVLVTLTVLFPPALDEKANPFSTPEHIKPEWYFLAGYQFLKVTEKLSFLGAWAPKLIGVMGQGIILMLILILPLIDRNPERSPANRKGMIAIGILFYLLFGFFTAWGYFS